jgi:type IV secretory pathway VirB9-like protein
MRATPALAAALGLWACQPMQQPPVVRIAPLPVAPKPAEPPSTEVNPVKFEAVASPRAGNALARLREANKEASRSVFDGYFTGATVNFRWKPGEVYDVVLARNRTTNLALAPGEGYVNAVFGDDRYFGLSQSWAGTKDTRANPGGPAASRIPIVAWEGGHCTDLTLYTTWREILMNVCSNGSASAYNKSISWTFPDDEKARVEAGLRNAVSMEPSTGIPVDQIDSHYKFDGPAEWKPAAWQAFNDHKKMYVVPPSNLPVRPVPAILADGHANTPEYRMLPAKEGDGAVYEIDAIPDALIFQYGDQILTARRAK